MISSALQATPEVTFRQAHIDELHEDEANVRLHGQRNKSVVHHSLKKFGQVQTLVIEKGTGRVLGGNCTLGELRSLGATDVWIAEVDVQGDDATQLALLLNRSAELATWDEKGLRTILLDLRTRKIDIEVIGFDLAMLGTGPNNTPDPGPAPTPREPKSTRGTLYQLGPHRVWCGDSGSAEGWDILLAKEGGGAELLDMLLSDPPYGITYVRPGERGVGGSKASEIANDELTGDGLREFLRERLGLAYQHSKPGAAWYIFCPPGGVEFRRVLREDLGVFRHGLVWVKDQFVLGRSDYHYQHEDCLAGMTPGALPQAFTIQVFQEDGRWHAKCLEVDDAHTSGETAEAAAFAARELAQTILEGEAAHQNITYGWKKGAPHYFIDSRKLTSVINCPRPKRSRDHATMKPIALLQPLIEHSSRTGESVGDCFGGSGSTLIAAARSGRIARLIEIEPKYVDVIRDRWTVWAKEAKLDPGPDALVIPR